MKKLLSFYLFYLLYRVLKILLFTHLQLLLTQADGGTVSPSTQQYDEGKTATITATAIS